VRAEGPEPFGLSQESWPPPPSSQRSRNRLAYVILLLAMALLAAVVGILYLPGVKSPHGPVVPVGGQRPLEQVSDLTFPADLLWQVSLTHTDDSGNITPDSAVMPAGVSVVDGRIFILDTNNGRILEIDNSGNVVNILDSRVDERLALVLPMAISDHAGRLYVANSGAGNIVVVDPGGAVERVVTPQVPAGPKPLRPVGIDVAEDGTIFVSDADNHRVLHLAESGALLSTIGLGVRDSGDYGLNTPGGVAVDRDGNVYVVDMLNYSVKKYSPSGEFLAALGEAGDTEASFSRPKSVAIDGGGRVFASDTLLVAVEAFQPDGAYAGFIGRKDAKDRASGSIFQAPHGLAVDGDTLYVIDRFAGLFAFRLPQ
jgi:DNA-binding beta-propeller fold protein YncE